jgi:hypothetical protein
METESLPDPIENAERCVYGDPTAEKTAVILGDSVAISYAPAIRAALEPQGYKVRILTMQQCPWVSVSVIQGSGEAHPSCDSFREWAFEEVQESKPDLVLLSGRYTVRLASESSDTEFEAEWREGARSSFTNLAGAGKVIVLDPPPTSESLTDCATRVSVPSDCETQVEAVHLKLAQLNRQAADAAGSEPPVKIVNTNEWFCLTSNRCPAFVGDTPVLADGIHLTSSYAKSLGPVLSEALADTSTP